MSRIWDALKQAENERSRAKGRKRAGGLTGAGAERIRFGCRGAGAPELGWADRRRSERWGQPVPVPVYGSHFEKPFHEETETAASRLWVLFYHRDRCREGQRLFLVNMLNDAERECRVVEASRRGRGKAEIAVVFCS